MRYMTALICPPLAMVRSGRPGRAIGVILLLVVAVLTWSSSFGLIPAAMAMLWACRTVGEREAKQELQEFLRLFSSPDERRI